MISTRCYLCHRNLRRRIRWFSPNGKHYYSLSYCDKHGFMKGKIRIRKAEDDRVFAVKTTKIITEEEAKQLQGRREHTRQMRRERRGHHS